MGVCRSLNPTRTCNRKWEAKGNVEGDMAINVLGFNRRGITGLGLEEFPL